MKDAIFGLRGIDQHNFNWVGHNALKRKFSWILSWLEVLWHDTPYNNNNNNNNNNKHHQNMKLSEDRSNVVTMPNAVTRRAAAFCTDCMTLKQVVCNAA